MSLTATSPEFWPVLLTAVHLAQIFGCSVRSAQRKMAKGVCGPVIEIDGKRFVRREAFLAALRDREQKPQTSRPFRPRRRRSPRRDSRHENRRDYL